MGCTRSPCAGRLSDEIVLFRLLQESLTSMYRHSGSKTASVEIAAGPDQVWLEVRDERMLNDGRLGGAILFAENPLDRRHQLFDGLALCNERSRP